MNIYLLLFLEFFKIGLFTFGGGYAMIPFIEETVLSHGWLTEGEVLNMIGISECTPGPIAVNMATYVGSSQGGFLGATLATLGVILPSFIIMLLITILLRSFLNNRHVQSVLNGIKPVALGLIIASAIMIAVGLIIPFDKGTFTNFSFDYKSLIVVGIIGVLTWLFKLIFKKRLNTIYVILLGAVVGLAFNYILLAAGVK